MSRPATNKSAASVSPGPPNWPLDRAPLVCLLVAALAAAVCLVASSTKAQEEPLYELERACKGNLDFKTVAEFRQFAIDLRELDASAQDKKSPHLLKCLAER